MRQPKVIKESELLREKETAEHYAHVIKQMILMGDADPQERVFERWCKAFNCPSTYEEAMERCYKDDCYKDELINHADMLWEATLEEYEKWNSYANGYVFKDIDVASVKL